MSVPKGLAHKERRGVGSMTFQEKYKMVFDRYETLVNRKNEIDPDFYNGVYDKYRYPVLTRNHIPPVGNMILIRKQIPIL